MKLSAILVLATSLALVSTCASASTLANRRALLQSDVAPPSPSNASAAPAPTYPAYMYTNGVINDSPQPNAECDCDHHNHGCVLSMLPPPGKACLCKVTVAGSRCDGYLTDCQFPDRASCTAPAFNVDTCLQGKGDCDGYNGRGCDCDHHGGGTLHSGCAISQAAAPGLACFCDVTISGARCEGYPRLCQQPNSPACRDPGMNLASCLQGGGDCDAYEGNDATCDCTAKVTMFPPSVGCQVVRAAPANTACRCDLVKADPTDVGVCKGKVVLCKDPTSSACLKPSTDKASCEQGAGSCLYD